MAVEIVILSGSRQGQSQETDLQEFRAGPARDCEVCFDPRQDPGSAQPLLAFRLEDDGWKVKNFGGGRPLVNATFVVGTTRIRSGDIVRLSELGPDFAFNIHAGPVKAAVAIPAAVLISARPVPSPIETAAFKSGGRGSCRASAHTGAGGTRLGGSLALPPIQPPAPPAHRLPWVPRPELVGVATAALVLGILWTGWSLLRSEISGSAIERQQPARAALTVTRGTNTGAAGVVFTRVSTTADQAADVPTTIDLAPSPEPEPK